MRREGSPWTGLWAVFFKEMADHLTGLRMRILEVLILLSALGALYTGSQALRQTVGEDPFLYLKLLTTAQDPLPSFVGFLSFFIPLAAIALAFDAVNGEYARGTLSRVLSQPIYRDALLFGKFLAGLGTLALLLFALFLMVVGLGLLRLGVPPGSEEVGRAFFFLLATLGYAGVWLALGLLFSVLFRQPATAALAPASAASLPGRATWAMASRPAQEARAAPAAPPPATACPARAPAWPIPPRAALLCAAAAATLSGAFSASSHMDPKIASSSRPRSR